MNDILPLIDLRAPRFFDFLFCLEMCLVMWHGNYPLCPSPFGYFAGISPRAGEKLLSSTNGVTNTRMEDAGIRLFVEIRGWLLWLFIE